MELNLAVDHVALALANCRHVDRDRPGHRAELRAVTRQMRDLRAPNLVLARQAGDVGTGAADPPALHHSSPPPGLSHMPREQLAGLSTAEDQNFKLFRIGHEPSP